MPPQVEYCYFHHINNEVIDQQEPKELICLSTASRVTRYALKDIAFLKIPGYLLQYFFTLFTAIPGRAYIENCLANNTMSQKIVNII